MAKRSYFKSASAAKPQATTTHERGALWSAKRVAERLGVTPWTVYRLMRDHKLPYVQVGSQYRFEAADVEAWIAARRGVNDTTGFLQLVASR